MDSGQTTCTLQILRLLVEAYCISESHFTPCWSIESLFLSKLHSLLLPQHLFQAHRALSCFRTTLQSPYNYQQIFLTLCVSEGNNPTLPQRLACKQQQQQDLHLNQKYVDWNIFEESCRNYFYLEKKKKSPKGHISLKETCNRNNQLYPITQERLPVSCREPQLLAVRESGSTEKSRAAYLYLSGDYNFLSVRF